MSHNYMSICVKVSFRARWFQALALAIIVSPHGAGQSDLPAVPAPLGSIAGSISGPSGQIIPAVRVAAVRIFPVGGSSTNPPLVMAVANLQGQYTLPNVSAGSYKICVVPEGLALLDPCLWSSNPPFTNVTPGRNSKLDVQLEAGSWLYVHVDDADGEADKKQKTQPSKRALSIGVRTVYGPIEDLQQVSGDTKNRNYRIAVPRNTDLALMVDGDDLSVEDNRGRALGKDTAPGQVRVGTSSQTVELKIKKNPGKN